MLRGAHARQAPPLSLAHLSPHSLWASNVRDPSRFLLDIPPHLLEGNVVRSSLARGKAYFIRAARPPGNGAT